MKRQHLILAVTVILASGIAGNAGAQPITDAHIRELIKEAARQTGAGAQAADPAQRPAAGASRPTVRLTLDDAVKFALDRNLDISVQRLNPQINDISYAGIRAVYRPSLTSTLSTQSATTPTTTTLAGGSQIGAPVVAGVSTYNGGVFQSVPWGGGSFAVSLNNNKQTTTSLNVFYNPAFNTNWSASYVQPLMRNLTMGQHVAAFLEQYPWPGNIRELRHVARYAVALCDGGTVTLGGLPERLVGSMVERPAAFDGVRAQVLQLTLTRCKWNVSMAARMLGISRSTLHRQIRLCRLQRP